MFGSLNSASAISAALRMAWPAVPAFPMSDNGRINATLTRRAPGSGASAMAMWGGALVGKRSVVLRVPLQPASPAAAAIVPAIAGVRHDQTAQARRATTAENSPIVRIEILKDDPKRVRKVRLARSASVQPQQPSRPIFNLVGIELSSVAPFHPS